MNRHRTLAPTSLALLASAVVAVGWPAAAAEVTPDRLINADKEPQNWLMNHRTYDAQRYSPLDRINKGNVKALKLAYAVAIGGNAVNAPPMTFEVGGKQYIAILTGLSRQSKGRLVLTPELGEIRNQTMLFVFGL